MTFDPRLYLILDTSVVHRPLDETIGQALDGGVTIIQLRCKLADTRQCYEQARAVRTLIRNPQVRFIVNDRVDIAMAVDADGVHLGTDDLPIQDARRLIGDDKIIGASANTIAEAKAAQSGGANYLGVGAVFPTASKSNTKNIIGIDGLKEIISYVTIPVVAIGGISEPVIADVMAAGASGVAVISAILRDPSPLASARHLRHCIQKWSQEHDR